MSARKHLGRGLDSVSHLFLSRRPEPAHEAPAATATSRASTPWLFVASGSEVIGKSVVACNVALELARRGHTTAVVDADPRQPTVRLLMGTLLGSDAEAAHGVALYATLEQAQAADEAWDYVVVNAPSRLFAAGAPPADTVRLLLVVSAEPRELIRSYALVKRTARWHCGLELGMVVSGVEDEASARAFFDQVLDVLERQLAVRAAYCGFLPEHDEIGRSVLCRTPAVVAPEESDLGERLRGIAAAVAREFEPAGSARNA
jgi:MinD-like ATPase involved in chromosome partitioning or flagellar assembly